MALPYSSRIPGLRGPFDLVNGNVNSGRMLNQIRLSSTGQLPETREASRGETRNGSFDWRCRLFLQIDCAALEVETLRKGKTDEKMLAWAFAKGRQSLEYEIDACKAFETGRGWRDASTQRLNERLAEIAEGHSLATKQAVALVLEEP